MFFGSFAWSFVFVSLPFHIQRISPLDPAATLRWTGWILGITSLVTVATAPVWGRYAARGDPKACYVAVEALQGLAHQPGGATIGGLHSPPTGARFLGPGPPATPPASPPPGSRYPLLAASG